MSNNNKNEGMSAKNNAGSSPSEIMANINQNETENANANPGGSDEVETETDTVVQFRPKAANRFAENATRESKSLASKSERLSKARELLHSVAEIAIREGQAAEAAMEPANKAAFELYRGLADNSLSNEEVTELLGAEFGFKVKKDGKPSATPAGYGEEIRKRVQRLYKAHDYAIAGNEPVAFYEPLERKDVAAFLKEVEDGKRTPFAFYKAIGEFKSANMGGRPKLWQDPKRIAALTRDILADVSVTVEAVSDTPGLEAAYTGLWRALSIIGQELPEPETSNTEAA